MDVRAPLVIVFLNGKFVPEEQALVSVFDRSFVYGDGLFEAFLAVNGTPFRWDQHMDRLERSAERFRIPIPFSRDELAAATRELLRRNAMPHCVIRLTLSRGSGPRGYVILGSEQPVLVIALHPAPKLDPANPPQWKLAVSSLRVAAHDLIANHKTNSRVLQVLARNEAEARGADEGILVNTDGHITEGCNSNVFWIRSGKVCTSPISVGALPGITRQAVAELCAELKIPFVEETISPSALADTEGVFVSLTSRGVVEVVSVDGTPVARSPIVARLRHAYDQLVARECA